MPELDNDDMIPYRFLRKEDGLWFYRIGLTATTFKLASADGAEQVMVAMASFLAEQDFGE